MDAEANAKTTAQPGGKEADNRRQSARLMELSGTTASEIMGLIEANAEDSDILLATTCLDAILKPLEEELGSGGWSGSTGKPGEELPRTPVRTSARALWGRGAGHRPPTLWNRT